LRIWSFEKFIKRKKNIKIKIHVKILACYLGAKTTRDLANL
jgi:hypothetical protein